MWNVVIEGIHPGLDGEYPIDFGNFKNKELRTIKLMSGVRTLEVEEAIRAGDNDFLIALAAIAMRRAGKEFIDDVLWEADAGTIQFVEQKDQEADARPPEHPKTEHEQNEKPDESKPSSGPTGNGVSDLSPPTQIPKASGTQDSDTGSPASDPATLAS